MRVVLFFMMLLSATVDSSLANRILGVFPHMGKSHYIVFEPMMLALADRGHEVVIITHFPMKNPPPNIIFVDVSGTVDTKYNNALSVEMVPGEMYNVAAVPFLANIGLYTCEKILSSKPVTELLSSSQKFDLVFYEIFNADCFLGFVHKYKAPSIAVATSSMMPWATARFGVPDNPSYIVNHFSGFSDSMSFFERILNTVVQITSPVIFSLLANDQNTALARKYFGNDMPPLGEIAKNTSLFLTNMHFSIYQVRPYPPNVIEVGGIHIKPPEKLEKDLQNFLDSAKEGVIYFSLGSTVRGATLPAEKRDAFIEAFSGLPQKVLWKWEENSIPNKPSNVRISKWVPQTAVLGHKNIKVFITHGGNNGMLEAVHFGVPMVCIPLLGDQFGNVGMAVKRGIAVKLALPDVTFETVRNAIGTVLSNSSYYQNAKMVSRIFHDRPQPPKEAVVYWTEYILKHKGASHLQSAAVNLSLVQYLLLDVILVLIVVPIFILVVSVLIVKYLCRRKSVSNNLKKMKQKRS